MRGLFRHRGKQRDRRCAAADDHDPLACVIEVLRPVLRMHDLATERLGAGELRREPRVVVVVARATKDPSRTDLASRSGVGVFDVDRPPRGVRRPGGRHHPMPVPDQRSKIVLVDRLVEVIEDSRGVGDCLSVGPGLEVVAEGVQVRVGPNSRVAEQVPRAARGVPGLEDDDRLAGVFCPHPAGRADAGDAGTDDEDIDFVWDRCHPALLRSVS